MRVHLLNPLTSLLLLLLFLRRTRSLRCLCPCFGFARNMGSSPSRPKAPESVRSRPKAFAQLQPSAPQLGPNRIAIGFRLDRILARNKVRTLRARRVGFEPPKPRINGGQTSSKAANPRNFKLDSELRTANSELGTPKASDSAQFNLFVSLVGWLGFAAPPKAAQVNGKIGGRSEGPAQFACQFERPAEQVAR